MGRIDELLDRCGSIAAVSSTVARVSSMISSGEYDPAEVERLIKADNALAASVLRLANSARYGVSGKTFTLHEAVVRLGSKTLLKLTLDQKTDELFADAGAAYGLGRHGLWRCSVAGAIASEIVATKSGVCDPQVAYIAGLLRDIGKLAIEAAFGPDTLRDAHTSDDDRLGFIDAERLAIGVDHPAVGAELAQRWSLPPALCDAIRYHHAPPAPGDADASALIDVVHAGDMVALWSGLAIGDDGLCYRLAPHVEDSLGISRQEVETEIAETWFRVRELEVLVGIPASSGAA